MSILVKELTNLLSHHTESVVYERAVRASGVDLTDVITICGAHFELMLKWNKVHNLSRITEPKEAAHQHYLDCILASSFIVGDRIIDLGSGAGFPGIVVAAMRPKSSFVLLDAARKRCDFLQEAARKLGLRNVEVVHARYQEYKLGGTITSRATISYERETFEPLLEALEPGSRVALLVSSATSNSDWKSDCARFGFEDVSYEVYQRLEQDRVVLGAVKATH